MNSNHQRLCASPEWAARLVSDVLSPLSAGVELGPELLEIGPGPGAATEWLRARVRTLVAVEIDPVAAFDTVASFTMLHHIPTQHGQNAVLAEALRVLRPGGVLLASDSRPSDSLHEFHAEDTYNPIDPAGLIARLQTIGYGRLIVEVNERWMVRAYKPADGEKVR
jgi:SAM-dependent methyltransferase